MQLNLVDPPYGRLAGFAGRLSRTLAHATTQRDRAVAGTLDEYLGVLYALNLARIQGFADRPVGTDIEIPVLQDRAGKLATGDLHAE